MSARSSPRPGPRAAYVEDYEDTDTSTDSESPEDEPEEEESEEENNQSTRPPANVGTKRSDPAIVKQQNKYATSDSGYSSLTGTTASSSQSKKDGQPVRSVQTLRQKVVQAFLPSKDIPSAPERPALSRRISKRHEFHDLRLRSVESREEAGRMRLSGAPVHVTSHRRPSEPVAVSKMPGMYPPSPKAVPAVPVDNAASASRPIPRPRATSTAYQQCRPVSFHSGAAPIMYQLPHQVTIVDPRVQPQRQQQPPPQQPPQQPPQPVYINNTSFMPPGSYPALPGYIPTPMSASPGPQPSYGFPPTAPNPYFAPQAQVWPHDPYTAHQQRISMASSPADYPHQMAVYTQQLTYEEPYPYSRRGSQTAYNPEPPFQPPPTPTDEGVFLEDEDYYRAIMPPPPRPFSAHRQRPPIVHARTTSSVQPNLKANRLSRSSIEYTKDSSPRKSSIDATRPPSRPGLPQRYSTSSHATRLQQIQAEPGSPVHRRRPESMHSTAEFEEQTQAAEAYQAAKKGGAVDDYVTAADIPPLARRPTRTSDTGSRGSGSRESNDGKQKRVSRQSLEKHKLKETHDEAQEYTVKIGKDVSVNMKRGNLGIKHSRDGDGPMQLSFGPGPNRPASTKPTRESARESSRVRSGASKNYIEGIPATSKQSQDKAVLDVARRRRSSSVQPRLDRGYGGDDDNVRRELVDPLRKLRIEGSKRQSRSSSRNAKAVVHR